jgi:hypothetical protein
MWICYEGMSLTWLRTSSGLVAVLVTDTPTWFYFQTTGNSC